MSDPTLSQAWKEACASAPEGEVMLHTLEFRHPNFVDDQGNPTAIRVVLEHQDLVAQLESTAPLNPSEYVTFVAFAFSFTLPESTFGQSAELTIVMDNVSQDIENSLALATASPEIVEVTYRAYLSSDLTTPQNIPVTTMTLTGATATDTQVEARANFGDPANLLFPTQTYQLNQFLGLER